MILIFLFLFFFFGLIVGSFINALQWRLPQSKTMWGRSECIHCHHRLAWTDLLPILSFVFLNGRCRYCHKPIPPAYPLTEFAMGIVFLLVGYMWATSTFLDLTPSRAGALLVRDLLAVTILAAIFLIDLHTLTIPDELTIPAIIGFGLIDLLLGMSAVNLLFGIVVGGGFFLVLYLLTHGRGMGDGDIRLGVLMGVLLGWPQILLAIFLAYLIGAFVAMLLLAGKKKTMKDPIPFGPFLSVATVVVLIFGSAALDVIYPWVDIG
jgi:prepilin signal peptidase PulO-like enzyme (type II secretory pathway)